MLRECLNEAIDLNLVGGISQLRLNARPGLAPLHIRPQARDKG